MNKIVPAHIFLIPSRNLKANVWKHQVNAIVIQLAKYLISQQGHAQPKLLIILQSIQMTARLYSFVFRTELQKYVSFCRYFWPVYANSILEMLPKKGLLQFFGQVHLTNI